MYIHIYVYITRHTQMYSHKKGKTLKNTNISKLQMQKNKTISIVVEYKKNNAVFAYTAKKRCNTSER